MKTRAFFYGLFMDREILRARGIEPTDEQPGFVDDFELVIGERATLICKSGARAHGVVMSLSPDELSALYSDVSVSDYRPEPVAVTLPGGSQVDATCYNLSVDRVTGTNREYAAALLQLATRLRFPDAYLESIREAATDDERH